MSLGKVFVVLLIFLGVALWLVLLILLIVRFLLVVGVVVTFLVEYNFFRHLISLNYD